MERWTEAEIDVQMGTLLKWGVILATVVMLIGAAVFLLHNGKSIADYKTFRNPTQSMRGIVEDARRGDGGGLILLAVLLIVATPVARVLFAVYAFARIRDWLYAAISTIVLALLLFAIVHSV